jgi:hypothetical protein
MKHFIAASEDCADTWINLRQIYLQLEIQIFHGDIVQVILNLFPVISVNFMYVNLL